MTTEEEERAREEAEARRRRILEGAENRMGIVAGSVPSGSKDSSADGEEQAATSETTTTPEAASTATTASSKSSGASKLAAMRRRRFKKGGAKKEKDTTTTQPSTTESSSTPANADEATATLSNTVETDTKSEDGVAKPDESTEAESVEKAVAESKIPDPVVDELDGDKKTSTVESEAEPETVAHPKEGEESKKKYMGVAKMRRRMIKERQQQNQKSSRESDDAAGAESESSPVPSKAPPLKKKKKRTVDVLPIIMHSVTLILIFLAGLDIGLQQGCRSDSVIVHAQLAPRQTGFQVLEVFSGAKSKLARVFGDEDDAFKWKQAEAVENEFDEDSQGDDDSSEENIDPLFGVDLDKYTRGPGIFMTMGRFAVSVHRMNLNVFYYAPRGVFLKTVKLFTQMLDTPPMPCLVAILLRQLVGYKLLGATLPKTMEDESQQKDVLSMIKNALVAFVVRAFPTATSLYEGFVHLREDMFIMLCGFFVGLAWTHAGNVLEPIPDVGEEESGATTEESGMTSGEL